MTLMLRNDARVVEWEPAVCRSLRVERDSDAALAERYRRRKHLRRTDKVHLVWGEGGQVLPMARREGRRALLVAKAPPLQPEAASTAPVQASVPQILSLIVFLVLRFSSQNCLALVAGCVPVLKKGGTQAEANGIPG